MLLPITVIYDDSGRLERIRYIEYALNKGSPVIKGIIERPAKDLIKPYIHFDTPYYGIHLDNMRGITKLDANGNPSGRQYAQVIPLKPFGEEYTFGRNTIAYVVDYTGKVFQIKYSDLHRMVMNEEIYVGNLTLLASPINKAFKSSMCHIAYLIADFDLHRDALRTQADMQGLNRLFLDKFTIAHLEYPIGTLYIPKGIFVTNIHGVEEKAKSIRNIIFPEIALDTIISLPWNRLDIFKAPKEVFVLFDLRLRSANKLILPERVVYKVYSITSPTYFKLELDEYLGTTLNLPDCYFLSDIYTRFKSSPSLTAINSKVAIYPRRARNMVYSVTLDNAPNFKSLVIDEIQCPNVAKPADKEDIISTFTYISKIKLEIHAPIYSITLNVMVSHLELYIPDVYDNIEITLNFQSITDFTAYVIDEDGAIRSSHDIQATAREYKIYDDMIIKLNSLEVR